MINVQTVSRGVTRLVVQGNQSMSWRANVWLAVSLGTICMGIALAMASQGLWLVIPFAGLEFVFIVCCLYLTLRRLERREVITIDPDLIKVEWGRKAPESRMALPRAWSVLLYHRPDSEFEVGELHLSAHGRRCPLGRCLGREEKQVLYQRLDVLLDSEVMNT